MIMPALPKPGYHTKKRKGDRDENEETDRNDADAHPRDGQNDGETDDEAPPSDEGERHAACRVRSRAEEGKEGKGEEEISGIPRLGCN